MKRIGICDWGVGGLPMAALLQARWPGVEQIYLSDSGSTPYGKQDPAALHRRLSQVARFFEEAGAERLYVACNAASSVLRWEQPAGGLGVSIPVVGVIRGAAAALLADPTARRVGVIGGDGTIASGAWSRPLECAGREVWARAAQPLSARVEAGDLSSPALEAELERILGPLGEARLDVLVLGCTHYPALAGPIAARLPGVRLFDPVAAVVDAEEPARPGTAAAARRVCTTGDPAALQRAARAAFGIEVGPVTRLAQETLRPAV